MRIGFLFVLLFFGYVAWKYYQSKPRIIGNNKPKTNVKQDRPGISWYCGNAAPQSAQQLQAFSRRNKLQTTQPGFSPAFGAQENQPSRQYQCV